MAANQEVKITTRLWSEEVRRADPEQRSRKEIAYLFSGERRFENTDGKPGGPYKQP